MPSLLSKATKGIRRTPLNLLVYSIPKWGKSTLVSGAPNPIFLDGEEGTDKVDTSRVELGSWGELLQAIDELIRTEHDYRTVVIDTLDAYERHLIGFLLERANRNRGHRQLRSIEQVGGGYGKGWIMVAEEWGKLFAKLRDLRRRGLNVILLGHAAPTNFSDPDGDSYNRWDMVLSKKSRAAIVGYVDDILFGTRLTRRDEDSGKAKGDQRVLISQWGAGREAGSRLGLGTIEIPYLDPARHTSAQIAQATWSRLQTVIDQAYERLGDSVQPAQPTTPAQPVQPTTPAPRERKRDGIPSRTRLHEIATTAAGLSEEFRSQLIELAHYGPIEQVAVRLAKAEEFVARQEGAAQAQDAVHSESYDEPPFEDGLPELGSW